MTVSVPYEFIWVAADGTPTVLSDVNGYRILKGVSGLDAPPVQLSLKPRTTGDGSILANRRNNHRYIDLPMWVHPADNQIRSAINYLADVFTGPGTLRVSDNGTTYKDLRNVYYAGGLEGDESGQRSMPHAWRKVIVSLVALDPWWYATETTTTLDLGGVTDFNDATVDFSDPFTQFNGGGSTLVAVAGNADAFPVWTITGPFDTLTVSVFRAGQFRLAAPLAAGEIITINTRPGTTRGPQTGGMLNFGLLSDDSVLPTFPKGTASITAVATGTTGASSVTVTHEPRWLTP